MTVGRNDPCPCGSGKKYKKCCQPRQAVVSLASVREDNLFRDIWDKLADYMGGQAQGDEVADGFTRFFVVPMDEEDGDETAEMAMDWVAFAYRTADGTTFCERFAASGKRLSPEERAVLHAWTQSAPGFFRVEAATGGDFQLSRLPDGQVFSVRAPGMKLAAGDLVSAWLLPVLSGYRFGYLIQDIDAEALDPLMHLVQIEMALLKRQRPAATWEELLREHWPRLTDAFSLAVADGENALQIALPPGPSVRWAGGESAEESVTSQTIGLRIAQALEEMDDGFEPGDIQGVQRLWIDAELALRPRIGRPEGWAAAALYLFLRNVLGEEVTQAHVAEIMQVSVSTVGTRSRELSAVLHPDLMDPRYVDLMSPFVRMHWRMYCLEAMGQSEEPPAISPDERRQLERTLRFLEESRRPERPVGPVQRAEELIDQEWEASGSTRTRLAREALNLWPDAADAYVMLGQAAEARGRLDEARRLYEAGMRAGERALGPAFFAENVGHFYGLVESRPYMRARAGLAGSLSALGKWEAAVAHYTEMLRLNPNDNQGIRYLLAAAYLTMGDDDRLGRHLAEHEDDATAAIAFTRALWQFRRSGPGQKADSLLTEAMAENPHVAAYLLGEKRLPAEPPAYLDFGGEMEAVGYAWDFGAGWRQTAGALDWLRSRVH